MDEIEFGMIGIGLLAGFAGGLFHYLKKWSRNEIKGSLYSYLFKENPRATVWTVVVMGGAVFSLVAVAGVDPNTLTGIISLFTAGYSIDSSVNKV